MAHTHGHSHGQRSANRRRLALTLLLAGGYLVAEVVGGLLTNSLALLADAGHMLSDVAALALSLFAVWIAERPPTPKRTYGYYRAEILAALANGASLVAISLFIFVEAYHRLRQPPEVQGAAMLAIAAGGLVVNLLGLWILREGREESLNVRGAWLHVLTDALGSVGAILAAGLIWAFGWNWADPAASVLIGLLVVYSSWRLLAESAAVLMESAPKGTDVDEVWRAMREVPGVLGVHDLHVWTITSGMECLSAHVVVEDGRPHGPLLGSLRNALHERFGIGHVTLQIEPEDFEEEGVVCPSCTQGPARELRMKSSGKYPTPQEVHPMAHQEHKSCIEACVRCAQECEHCADACLSEQDVSQMAECIRLDRDCAEMCWGAAAFMSRGSQFANDFCRLCAEVCDACAAECEKHEAEHCKRCAEACRRCAEECRSMAGAGV